MPSPQLFCKEFLFANNYHARRNDSHLPQDPRMYAPFARSALAVALIGCSLPALANNDPVNLDTMVVSASGFEQKITDAPASISVISQEDLQQKRYGNLAQALDEIEGVDIRQGTGKTGGLDISMRGMPS